MMDEELDDTHMCIKCRTTLIGLDNYVRHRKTNCSDAIGVVNKKTLDAIHHSFGNEAVGPGQVHHAAGSTMNSNVPAQKSLPSHSDDEGGKKDKNYSFTYDLGESGGSVVVANLSNNSPTGADNKIDNTTETQFLDNYIYGLGADVFFSSLELQSSKRGEPSSSTGKHGGTGGYKGKTRKTNASILPNSLMEMHNLDQYDKFLSAGQKKHDNIFGLFQSESLEDDDDTANDVDDIVIASDAKWKLGNNSHAFIPNSPQWDMRHHNWIMGEDNLSDKADKLHKSLDDDLENMEDEYKGYSPPPGHTRGKWVPGSKLTKFVYPPETQLDSNFSDDYWCSLCDRKLSSRLTYERHLKTNIHTKKVQQDNEFDKISKPSAEPSPELYSRRKRIITKKIPIDTIAQLVRQRRPRKHPKKKIRTRKCYFIKCSVCSVRIRTHLFGKHLISHYHYRCMSKNYNKSIEIILQNMDKIVLQSPFQCQPCRFYANTQAAFIRHWDSAEHEECVAEESSENDGELSGAPSKARQFWCSQCKYVCKGNAEMRQHLQDREHQQVIQIVNRSVPIIIRKRIVLSCNNCHQEFHFNIELRKHVAHCTIPFNALTGIVDGKTNDLELLCKLCNINFKSRFSLHYHERKFHSKIQYYCSICNINFKTTLASKLHRRTMEHKIMAARAGEQHDALIKTCHICKDVQGDILAVKEHIRTNHPEIKYSCPHCGENFVLPQEVSRHVRDKICKFYNDTNNPVETVTLPETDTESQGLAAGSSLIANDGIATTVSSSQAPAIAATTTTSGEGIENTICLDDGDAEDRVWTCPTCPFTTESMAENMFHQILHNYSTKMTSDNDTKLECPVCSKSFRKASLRCHLRHHTNERIFQCPQCPSNFVRKWNLKNHVDNIHGKRIMRAFGEDEHQDYDADEVQDGKDIADPSGPSSTSQLFPCSICGKTFATRHLVTQHMHTHRNVLMKKIKRFSCDWEDCIFSGRSAAELRTHLLTHSDVKPFACTMANCDFRTKTKALLRRHAKTHSACEKTLTCATCQFQTASAAHYTRHMLIHTNAKTFKCPYCKFTCNNSDNLRKHVISTKKHIGRSIYECAHCAADEKFASNYLKAYTAHLLTAHNLTLPEVK